MEPKPKFKKGDIVYFDRYPPIGYPTPMRYAVRILNIYKNQKDTFDYEVEAVPVFNGTFRGKFVPEYELLAYWELIC